ncbi:MAG: AAA family ATPase [Chloroflexi bacterium]|nr:AAA family ATPase [Chloroflexota bacterium]
MRPNAVAEFEARWADRPKNEEYFAALATMAEPADTPGYGESVVRAAPPAHGPVPQHEAKHRGAARLVRMSDVMPERVSWVWQGRIPLGKVCVVDGDPNQGKSTMTLDLAARVSHGRAMPDGTPGIGPADVIILSAEDGLGDTIRPRLEAAGADLARIHALTTVGADSDLPTIPADIGALEAAINGTGARLVIIDPLMAYLGADVNGHRDQDVRRALAPLAALGERADAAVMLVRHLNKSTGGTAIYRGGGSIGIGGAARSVLLVARDPDADPEDPEPRHIVAVVKNNLARQAPALAYRLVDDPTHGCARVVWEGSTHHRADDLLALPNRDAGEAQGDRAKAGDFLRDLLAYGPVPTRAVKDAADAHGHSWASVRRAKDALGVTAAKEGRPGDSEQRWVWSLPPEGAQDSRTRSTPQAEHLRHSLSTFGDDMPIDDAYDPEYARDDDAEGLA